VTFVKLLPGVPAAVVGDALALAEMHLGIEFSFHEKGARVFPDAKKSALEVNKLLKLSGTRRIIFLGDLKQDVRSFAHREKKLLEEFLSLLKVDEKILVKGNHDSSVEEISGLQVSSPEGIVVQDWENGVESKVGLAHGHAWPSKEVLACPTVCLGHTHPLIEFADAIGSRRVEKIWLAGKTKFLGKKAREIGRAHGVLEGTKIVVFPAFSKWVGGIPVNARFPAYSLLPSGEREKGIKKVGLLGPVFSNGLFNLQDALAYTLDGTELGKISFLQGKAALLRPVRRHL